jgi:hypothetical protein
MPDLQIVIINNEPHKPVKQSLAFSFCEPVDVLHVMPDGEDGLPACDGVGANDRVHGDEFFADIFGSPAGFGVDFETVFLGGFVEFWLGVGGS